MVKMNTKTYKARFEVAGVPADDLNKIMTEMFEFTVDATCAPVQPGQRGLAFEGIKQLNEFELPDEIHRKVAARLKKFYMGARVRSIWTVVASTRPMFADVKPVVLGDYV
jgi:hypothetical protein